MADGDVTDVADSEKAATSSAVLSESSYRHPFNDNDAIRSMSGSVGESAVKSLLDTKGHALEVCRSRLLIHGPHLLNGI
jgi:hypothetical protein